MEIAYWSMERSCFQGADRSGSKHSLWNEVVESKCRLQRNIRRSIDFVGYEALVILLHEAVRKTIPTIPDLLNVSLVLPGNQNFSIKPGKGNFYIVCGKNCKFPECFLESEKIHSDSICYENT